MPTKLTRRHALWLGLLTGVAALGVALYPFTVGPVPEPTETPSPSSTVTQPNQLPEQSTQPAPTTATVQIKEVEATEALELVLHTVAEALRADSLTSTAIDLSTVLADNALETHQALMEQWAAEGIRQEGAPVLEQVEVLSQQDDHTLVQACVVTSNVHIFDDLGHDLTSAEAPKRTRTIFKLGHVDGVWKLFDESFAEALDC